MDEYIRGDVVRISPEAPVPVVDVKARDQKLGLSANVAANVQSLGGDPLLFSVIGGDSNGESLKTLLRERNISTQSLVEDSRRGTTKKLRIMSSHQHIVRVDFESKKSVHPEILLQNQDQLLKALDECHCVVIQDYDKGLVNRESCQKLIRWSKEKNKPVLVDPHRRTPLEIYEGARLMTPNRDEALELARQIPKPGIWGNLDAIGFEFMNILKSPQMVVTLGDQGMKLFDGENVSTLPTFARQVFDVTGAGDTVIAAFALAFCAGWSLEEGGILANLAAGIVVGQVGLWPVPWRISITFDPFKCYSVLYTTKNYDIHSILNKTVKVKKEKAMKKYLTAFLMFLIPNLSQRFEQVYIPSIDVLFIDDSFAYLMLSLSGPLPVENCLFHW